MRQPSGWPEKFRLLTRQFSDTVLDFVFPPRCVSCGRVGSLFCRVCQAEVIVPTPPTESFAPLTELRAAAEYVGPIRAAIKAFKYEGQIRLAEQLANILQRYFAQIAWMPTLITAIPLHAARQRSRGYNQAALLAELLADSVGVPFSGQALMRVRNTRPQVGLDAKARRANIQGAFEADPAIVRDQRIVIVDDVSTTGATLREGASALLEAGALCVWGLTVARPGQRVDLASI